ncbi:MAG: hypothetical protein JXD23_14000 [Spirochaetales bacterium]|nr:hypothetical protein [Spirochaetales bacterium]
MRQEGILFGDALLVAVFAQFPNATFKINDESDIVEAFFKAKQTGKFSSLFTNYAFDSDGISPHSIAIEEGIYSLQQARLIGRDNPDLKEYKIKKPLKIRFDNFIKPNLPAEMEKNIEQLSEEIRSTLNIKTA